MRPLPLVVLAALCGCASNRAHHAEAPRPAATHQPSAAQQPEAAHTLERLRHVIREVDQSGRHDAAEHLARQADAVERDVHRLHEMRGRVHELARHAHEMEAAGHPEDARAAARHAEATEAETRALAESVHGRMEHLAAAVGNAAREPAPDRIFSAIAWPGPEEQPTRRAEEPARRAAAQRAEAERGAREAEERARAVRERAAAAERRAAPAEREGPEARRSHVANAVEHLHAAGMHDLADMVARQAGQVLSEGRRPDERPAAAGRPGRGSDQPPPRDPGGRREAAEPRIELRVAPEGRRDRPEPPDERPDVRIERRTERAEVPGRADDRALAQLKEHVARLTEQVERLRRDLDALRPPKEPR
jgi:hypothetical protein